MKDFVSQQAALPKLYELLRAVEVGKMSVKIFCQEYERTYNLELEKKGISEKEGQAFRDLFEKVVWFSPYPKERQQIPRYLGEEEILHAVGVASKALA